MVDIILRAAISISFSEIPQDSSFFFEKSTPSVSSVFSSFPQRKSPVTLLRNLAISFPNFSPAGATEKPTVSIHHRRQSLPVQKLIIPVSKGLPVSVSVNVKEAGGYITTGRIQNTLLRSTVMLYSAVSASSAAAASSPSPEASIHFVQSVS